MNCAEITIVSSLLVTGGFDCFGARQVLQSPLGEPMLKYMPAELVSVVPLQILRRVWLSLGSEKSILLISFNTNLVHWNYCFSYSTCDCSLHNISKIS